MKKFTTLMVMILMAAIAWGTVSAKGSLAVSRTLTDAETVVNNAGAKQLSKTLKADAAASERLVVTGKKGSKQANTARLAAPKGNGGTTTVTVPEGLQTETYKVTGFSFYDYAEVAYEVQVGIDGNDVYVQGLFRLLPEAWIKGRMLRSKITFVKDQYLGEAEVFDYYDGTSLGMYPIWMGYQNGSTGENDDFVLTYDSESGVMDDLEQGTLVFGNYDEMDFPDAIVNARLTPVSALSDVSYDLIEVPASVEQWNVEISAYRFATKDNFNRPGLMAVDGNDVYVYGLCPDLNAWVKGTLSEDGRVEFRGGQYVGSLYGMFDMWFMVTTENYAQIARLKESAFATWNAADRTLVFDEGDLLVENADPVSLYYADMIKNVTVTGEIEGAQLITPPAGLETTVYETSVASLGNYPYASGTYPVSIGFDGDDVYMKGLFYYAPNAWIKGTRNEANGSLHFAKNQYLGLVQGYDIYVVPCDDEENILDDFTFTYDAAKDTYNYIEQNTNISFSVAPDCTDAVEIIFNVVMRGPDAPDAPVINTEVIDQMPEGDLRIYTRNGGAYYTFWGYLVSSSQAGSMMKVVTNGNDVYMENPISQGMVEGGTWVKGTLEGNTIHMPLHQCILYSEYEGWGYMTATFRAESVYDEYADEYYTDYVMTDETEITFTIDEEAGTITMDRVSNFDEETMIADYIYGLAYTDDFVWAQIGDYNSVYTIFDDEICTMPEGLETEEWALMYTDDNGYYNSRLVDVAVADGKMYVAGMSEYDPEAVMVGTISDDKVTFASDQYLGASSNFLAYGVFAEYSVDVLWDDVYETEYETPAFAYLPEYSFAYDAENKLLTSADNIAFVLNAGKGADEMLYIDYAIAPKLNFFSDEPATPADPEVLGFSSWYEDYGYDMVSFNLPLEDVNGSYINKDKVYYILWVSIDGQAEPFTFTSFDYAGLYEAAGVDELVEVPYSLVAYDDAGYEDISEGASTICLYQSGFDDYGLQTIYYGGGERRVSNIVWLNGDITGIVDMPSVDGGTAIYDLSGRMMNRMQKGINIVKTQNGKIIKVCVK